MNFDLPNSNASVRLQMPFENASDALARFDERLRSNPVAEAFILRAHFHDACAALWRAGEFVQLEDLVLHDAGTDTHTPTHQLVRAHAVLLARRRIADREPGWALTIEGLASLRGVSRPHSIPFEATASNSAAIEDEDAAEDEFENGERSSTGEFDEIDKLLARTSRLTECIEPAQRKRDDSGLVYDDDWDEEARLTEWRARLGETANLPPLMAAGVALDAWEEIEPLQHSPWLGPLLVATLLRRRGKTLHHLSALHAGFRHTKYRTSRQSDYGSRLMAFAHAVELMAKADSKELDRLTLARELLLRKCKDRRTNSRLPRLVDLCLASPVVTVPFVAKELRMSQQAATTMIDELSSNLRELTGRRRYRAWAVI
ncbi:DUF1612 domain-containing protein [Methylosinus sp. H3A]|uniref:RHE_PE00001 family protein n=1 Tax=Methylosinus sp. H3A TaxID=2785786 RepID=UPI0018C301E2|nr:RHE_PE00001 family protein [Methylosinus sp. H3A]MBG0812407.1 DUF1612 domain-containing protein [Methylosinus sp. H3A]